MTQNQRYLDDTYCFSTISRVISCGSDNLGIWFSLEENIFHPQGGGQPADTGWVNDIPVNIGKGTDDQVICYPQSPLNVDIGDEVVSRVSTQERMHNAALHTAGHLLNWEMRKYGWVGTTGHHFPGESRVVFSPLDNGAVILKDLSLKNIEIDINSLLKKGKNVKTWIDGDTRFSFIDDTEPMPCAGTHVDNINSIDCFTIKSAKIKKGLLRISYDAMHLGLKNDFT